MKHAAVNPALRERKRLCFTNSPFLPAVKFPSSCGSEKDQTDLSSAALGQDFDSHLPIAAPKPTSFMPPSFPPPGRCTRNVMRQAFAGLLWTKQYYHYVVETGSTAIRRSLRRRRQRKSGRNHAWGHLYNADVISMPDKWEYPWYAAWDLAFHCVSLALVDPELCQGAARADAARVVHASERADSGL